MSNQITITTNNQARDVLRSYDLTEKERNEFDYLDEEQIEWASFFRYKGQVYDLGEFMNCTQSVNGFKDWHGIQSDSFFSGLLVRYAEEYCESVIVGRYYS